MAADYPDMTVRDAVTGDAPTIAEFNKRLALETEDKTLNDQLLSQGVEHAFGRPQMCRYFIAERAGTIVGQAMVTYEWSDWRDGVLWWFQSVYVHPEHRRCGVFRTLYQHIEALARDDAGCCGLRLYVEQNNHRAQETYRSLGMQPSGHVVYETDWTEE